MKRTKVPPDKQVEGGAMHSASLATTGKTSYLFNYKVKCFTDLVEQFLFMVLLFYQCF